MGRFNVRNLILITTLSAGAHAAYGQICVTSDSAVDTACGTNALANGSSDGGSANSAFGKSALKATTGGTFNTATGLPHSILTRPAAITRPRGVEAPYNNHSIGLRTGTTGHDR